MKRANETLLLDFCLAQKGHPDAGEWLSFTAVSRDELCTTALFLAGIDAYGNSADLQRIAHLIRPDGNKSFASMVQKTNFDCSRFSGLLKARLAHETRTSRA